MHLKNIILFFCLKFFFVQSQGAPPPAFVLDRIRGIIATTVGPDGKVDFERLREVIIRVGLAIGRPLLVGSSEDLDIALSYTNEEVETAILSFVGEGPPGMTTLVKSIVAANMEKADVDFDQLKVICTLVAEETRIPEQFLRRLDVFQRPDPNRKFERREIEVYALAFVGAADTEMHDIIKSEIARYGNTNCHQYKDIKKIYTRVKRRKHIARPFPSYADFKEIYKSGKYPVEEVEQIVINTYFPG